MPIRADRLLHHVRQVAYQAPADSDDAALLAAFVAGRDPTAFAALVARHGPMVLRVCRRVLGNRHDAEDAFQATFLVLARKAASIRRGAALAAWLHGVACRVARGARTASIRRRRRESAASPLAPPEPDPLAELTAREALQLLDEEVQRLPRSYRLPIILCCLEGLSQEEAARRLGWTSGSVKGRLERGRKRLHQELARRGLGLAAALAVVEVSRGAAAGLPAELAGATVKAAVAFAAGESAAAGPVSAELTALAEAGLQSPTLARAKVALLLLLAATATAAGVGMFAHQVPAGTQAAAQAQAGTKDKRTGVEQPKGDRPARTDRHGDPLPDGVLARLGTVRLRAGGARLALSADGKTIVAVTGGPQIKFWDAETGKLSGQRELPTAPSNEVFLSPDGRTLVIQMRGSDPTIDVWDIPSGKRLRRLRFAQKGGIYRAAFSADGKRLAVVEWGANDIILHLADIGSGESRILKGNKGPPQSLVFSADGKLLAMTEHGRVSCWHVARDEPLWQAEIYTQALAFTPDGRVLIASPGYKSPSWHCWEAATGKPAEGVRLPQGYGYANLVVAPDGRTLVFAQPLGVAGADHRVRLWDLRLGTLLRTLPITGDIGPFAPDGRSFLTNNGILQRWELATGRPLLPDTDALGHRANVLGVVYSPDGHLLASTADDGTIRLWELATARPLQVLYGHERWACGLAFTPDGKLLVSGGVEGELYVWDMEAGREIRRIPLHDARAGEKKQHVWRLHVTPDGRTVVVLGYDPQQAGAGLPEGIVTSWDLATGRRKTLARSPEASDGFCSGFSPDGRLLASCGLLLDTQTCRVRTRLEAASPGLGCYAFSPDGRLVAGLLTRHETDGLRHAIKMVGIQFWESASGAAVRRIPTDWVAQLAFSPDGRYLAAAGVDGIRLWELATGGLVVRHKAHERVLGSFGQSFASCLAFAPDGRSLATGHPDSTVLIWSLAPPTHPATSRPPAADLARRWKDLVGPDAAAAYAASWRLTEAPGPALLLLRQHLRPLKPAPEEQIRPLLADLDNDDFDRREAASARLRQLGERADQALRQELAARPSAEKRRRLEALLKALEQPSREALGELRAVAVLERLGTTESRDLLKELSEGDPRARLTREAKASLERLARRSAVPPARVSP
jgi:RNA polymerase sigma factor (sigma-70 family)